MHVKALLVTSYLEMARNVTFWPSSVPFIHRRNLKEPFLPSLPRGPVISHAIKGEPCLIVKEI